MTEKQRIERMMEKHKAYFENVKGVEVKNGVDYQKSCEGIALVALGVGRDTSFLAIKSKEEGRMMVERLWLNFR